MACWPRSVPFQAGPGPPPQAPPSPRTEHSRANNSLSALYGRQPIMSQRPALLPHTLLDGAPSFSIFPSFLVSACMPWCAVHPPSPLAPLAPLQPTPPRGRYDAIPLGGQTSSFYFARRRQDIEIILARSAERRERNGRNTRERELNITRMGPSISISTSRALPLSGTAEIAPGKKAVFVEGLQYVLERSILCSIRLTVQTSLYIGKQKERDAR